MVAQELKFFLSLLKNYLLSLIFNRQVHTLNLNHKDRLLRFDSEIIFYLCDLIKYIKWYKEQGYSMYEYIPNLEVFLKEQVELWKDDFEKIKNEE